MSPSLSFPSLIAHLDLKGVRFQPGYALEYLENLKALGYDAVLVEYEDLFPFRTACFSEHPGEVWSREFLRTFLEKAKSLGIGIIPLQQCLSHLEYIFRWNEYRRYCLPYGTPRDLHIGRPEARQWLKGLLEEVLEVHPDSRWIHIGMDEARPLLLHAQAEGREVLDLFLEYLDELCTLCHRHGKVPLIWSDMLEDHIAPEYFERLLAFRDRLVLVPWEYSAAGGPQPVVRFSGMRCSRRWLEEPSKAPLEARNLREGLLWFEDWPPEIKALVGKYQISPWAMEPFFQAAVWRDLGFTVWGAAAAAFTFDRSLLPHYHRRHENISAWRALIAKEQLGGLLATQWARSNSCSVPNLLPDVVWPVLARAGAGLAVFFEGIAEEELERLFHLIGRCREGWNLEARVLEEMDRLSPRLGSHHFEWATIRLMLEIQRTTRSLEELEELGRCYGGIGRLPGVAWEGRKSELDAIGEALRPLEAQARTHLGQRYHGAALEEWFYRVFTTLCERIARLDEVICNGIAARETKQPLQS
ncbi:MAG TPA: family 20 glycosylhydrolase [Chthoniobacteraceae bacterium]|nr:family 20 glycosylhydrolase [Chthoniobacteraceae bacterium]